MKMKYKVITRFEGQLLGRKVFDSLEEAAKYAQEKANFNPKRISEIEKVPQWTK